MATLTTLQFNHDALPTHYNDAVLASWAINIVDYLNNLLNVDLPDGVTLVESHHHEDAPAYMMLTAYERAIIHKALSKYAGADAVLRRFTDTRRVATAQQKED